MTSFGPMCVITSAIARFIPIFKLEYFWNAKTYTGEILIWCHIDGVLSEKPQNTHNLNCLFFNGCLGWKFKNSWNDWGIDKFFPTNTKFCDLKIDFALQWTLTDIDFSLFCFLLQPVFLTLTVNFSSFNVTYTFSALVFSVYGCRFAIPIYRIQRFLVIIVKWHICTFYSWWMSSFISLVWVLPSCEERETGERFKMKIYVSTGNRTWDSSFSNLAL